MKSANCKCSFFGTGVVARREGCELCDDEARYGEIGVMQLQVGLLLPEGLASKTSPLPFIILANPFS